MNLLPRTVTSTPLSHDAATVPTAVASDVVTDIAEPVVRVSESADFVASTVVLSDGCSKDRLASAVSSASATAASIHSSLTHSSPRRVSSSPVRCRAVCVSRSPAAKSINDSFSDDELHIVLPEDSFTASDSAADSQPQLCVPVEHSTAPQPARASGPQEAAGAFSDADSSSSAALMPSVADMLAEMSLFRPVSPVAGCQRCDECDDGRRVIVTRKRSVARRRLSEHSDHDDDAAADTTASSDHVRRTPVIIIIMIYVY